MADIHRQRRQREEEGDAGTGRYTVGKTQSRPEIPHAFPVNDTEPIRERMEDPLIRQWSKQASDNRKVKTCAVITLPHLANNQVPWRQL